MKRTRDYLAALSITALLLFSLPVSAQRIAPSPQPSQGQVQKFKKVANPIPNKYIVMLNDDVITAGRANADHRRSQVSAVAADLTQRHGGRVGFLYDAVKGFSIDLMSEQAAVALSRNPHVKFVEEVGTMQPVDVQFNPPWGLDRIDQAGPVGTVGGDGRTTGTYNFNATGAGVTAYVIDTGIRVTHSEFGGRASIAADFIGAFGEEPCVPTPTNNDCAGHGTHVAGTIGGSTFGVAKAVTVKSVKVCFGNFRGCPIDAIIAGVNFVTNEQYYNPSAPKVANMSLGGFPNDSVDNAVRTLIDSGVTVVVAAGNSTQDARDFSPARVEQVITVGASNSADQGAFFSNFGPALDIWAPGEFVLSAGVDNDFATLLASGTSMASPHTAGAVALYLQGRTTTDWCSWLPIQGTSPMIGGAISTCPDRVARFIKSNASLSKLSSIGAGSPNRLLFTGSLPTTTNPIDNQRFYIWQQYADFLVNEPEPDEGGLNFWTGTITGTCGTGFNDNNGCTHVKRIDASRAFWVVAFPWLVTNGGTQLTDNATFVHKCYEMYLRRSVPPSDLGFQFWLNSLNQYGNPASQPGIDHLIDAFTSSMEYRQRFGQ